MKLLSLAVIAFALLAGCAAKDTPNTPAGNETAPDGSGAVVPPTSVALSLFDRTPGVGVPPTTMGIAPNTLTLKVGGSVNLTVTNDGSMTHNLIIDGLDVATNDLAPGESVSVEFTPTEAGEYTMYCSIGGASQVGHQSQGMQGTITVA